MRERIDKGSMSTRTLALFFPGWNTIRGTCESAMVKSSGRKTTLYTRRLASRYYLLCLLGVGVGDARFAYIQDLARHLSSATHSPPKLSGPSLGDEVVTQKAQQSCLSVPRSWPPDGVSIARDQVPSIYVRACRVTKCSPQPLEEP